MPTESFTSGTTKAEKDYHIFISYRVATDSALAEKLCDKLQQLDVEREQGLRIKCFLDKQDLKVGENWEHGFLRGLTGSCLFVVLLSEAGLQYIVDGKENVKDNCLLEYETALKMQQRDALDILPIFVGSTHSGTYRKFNGFGFNFPDRNSATQPTGTIRETMQALFKLQGIFLNPEELKDKLGVIQNRLSVNVWPRFRDRWAFQDMLGPERTYTCVQCSQEYQETKNGEGACAFHLSGIDQRRNEHFCCKKEIGAIGCVRAKHHSQHHMEFRYATWMTWVRSIIDYSNTSELWTQIEAENLLTKSAVTMSIGKIILGGEEGKIYISMDGGENEKLWFKVYSKREITEVESFVGALAARDSERGQSGDITSVDGGKMTTQHGEFEFKWNIASVIEGSLTDYSVTGVTMKITSPTAARPAIAKVDFIFDENNLAQKVSEEIISTAGLDEAVPAKPYAFFTKQLIQGELIKEAAVRAPQKDFVAYGSLKARLKLISVAVTFDKRFNIIVNFINTNKTEAQTLIEGGAVWVRPPANSNEVSSTTPSPWTECESVKISLTDEKGELTSGTLPQKIGPGESLSIAFAVKLPADPLVDESMRGWSALARNGPLLFRVHLESMDGEKIYLPAEFVNQTSYWKVEDEERFTKIFADDVKRFHRSVVKVSFTPDDYSGNFVNITFTIAGGGGRGVNLNLTTLRSIVYHGSNNLPMPPAADTEMQNGEETPATKLINDLQLDKQPGFGKFVRYPDACVTVAFNWSDPDAKYYVETGFLVDLACQRVVAVIIAVVGLSSSALRVIPFPFYGLTSKVVDSPYFTKELSIKDMTVLPEKPESIPIRPIGPIPWLQAEIASFTAPPPSAFASSSSGVSVDVTAQLTPFFDKVFTRFSAIDQSLASLQQRQTDLEANLKNITSILSTIAANQESKPKATPPAPLTPKPAVTNNNNTTPADTAANATATNTPVSSQPGRVANAASQFTTNSNPTPPGSAEKKVFAFRKN